MGYWRRLSVGHKVVAPFVGLTLLVGLLVSAIAGQQLAESGAQQLNVLAVREQDNVNTVFNSVEEQELADLRLLSATSGVADALAAKDSAALSRLLLPIVANHLPQRVVATVVDLKGNHLIDVAADPQHPDQCVCGTGGGNVSYEHVGDVLAGRADRYGTRYAGLAQSGPGWLLYTIGPVIDSDGYLVGAILVGETLDQITSLIQERANVQLALFTTDGAHLAQTQRLDFPVPTLTPAQRTQVTAGAKVLSQRVSAGGHQAAIFFIPWMLRFETRGYASLVVPSDPFFSAQDLVIVVILVVCLGALALTLVVGAIVTRSITAPMRELIKATTEVAAGRLDYLAVVDSSDEIGLLARSFNAMTGELSERTRRLERLTDETLVTLAAAIDARDAYTHGHSMRVSIYADALAACAGLDRSVREEIKRGCMLHDIGKIGVPDSVLRKAGPLDERELDQMRQHTTVGHRLVSGLPWGRTVLDIVLYHHERWDGNGYPAGLSAEAIPQEARIVAIADTLDAMTSPRPYRAAFTFRRAAEEILRQSGRQFDPDMTAMFKARRREFSALVDKALGTWIPTVIRSRRPRAASLDQSRLKVVS
jgi:HAMP domain-containing protein